MTAKISRRVVLRGAGVAMALPFLESALWTRRSGAQSMAAPRRFLAWFVPNGMNMQTWTPVLGSQAGVTNWATTPALAPLEALRKKILLVSGTDNQAISYPGTPPGDHGAGTGIFLNGLTVAGNLKSTARTSVDQLLLPALNPGSQTKFPVLNLGLQGDNGLCDRVDCAFSRAMSWIKGAPQPNIYDPGLLWDKMFKDFTAPTTSGNSDAAAEAKQRVADKASILDLVRDQANTLGTKLSPSDKIKLDQFNDSVRALELKIQNMSTSSPSASCMPNARPKAGETLNFDRGVTPSTILKGHMPMFLELMKLALQCDMTRAITFMLGNGTSNNDYAFVTGSSTPHHATSHHDGDLDKLKKLTQINVWEMEQVATLLSSLDKIQEGDGTLLDHTTFYLGSDVSDGAAHNHWDMPVLLAGGGAGKLKIDGRHINYVTHKSTPRDLVGPKGGPVTGRILLSIMAAHGLEQQTLGSVTGGPLSELSA